VPLEKPDGIKGLLLDRAISSADVDVEARLGAEMCAARDAWLTFSMNDDRLKARCLDLNLHIPRLQLNS
jgi:hypothetical protein